MNDFFTNIFFMVLVVGGLLITLSVSVMFILLMERRVVAFMQDRLGPNRVGYEGLLQSVADGFKLMLKETIIPAHVDKLLFFLAPFLVFVPAAMAFAVFPLSKKLVAVDLNVGLLYLLSLSSIVAMGILLAGWSSNNKFSLLAVIRLVAKNISYEIPLVLSTAGVVMITGSLKLSAIIDAQSHVWFVLLQPVAFVIYFICALAEVNRAPFDLVEAESELVGGFHTEYSGFTFALFYLAEYVNMIVVSLLASVVFLGGWQGSVLPGFIWLFGKAFFFLFVMIWIRATLYRFRIDQLLSFCWKWLIPICLVNIALTGVGITVWQSYFR
ncbi:MAG: NADH-quinone oxidoreductase subunit NuoH [bacterium]